MANDPIFNTRKKYAFVGIGMHSLSNLYPLLSYFSISLKYICTQSFQSYSALSAQFPGCTFTNNINDIVNDIEIEGVFVCSSPGSHFDIISKLGLAGKKVFVEKPPCQTLEELERLLSIPSLKVCKVGLQRRCWPGNSHLFNKLNSARTYTYKFGFGIYPNGDPYTELFIHAIDYCTFLFGAITVISFDKQEYNGGITLQLHAKHTNGISALIEISTHFSWNAPIDVLTINCKEEIITAKYPTNVSGTQRPSRILHLPTERILNQPEITKQYFSANLVMPVLEMNTIVLQGFYKEIETFVNLVENNVSNSTSSDLPSLVLVYEVLQQLKS